MHLTIQQLGAQTDGELTGPSLTLVENHIAECETCWHEMERLAEQDALLASIIAVDPGEAFFEDLAASVEAEISGKKKPTPRPAARPTPAPPPVPIAIQRPGRAAVPPAPATPSPEPEVVSPAPAHPSPEPEAVSPAPAHPSPEPEVVSPAPSPEANLGAPAAPTPMPKVNLDAPAAEALPPLPIVPVGGWTPPAPGAHGGMAVEYGGAWTPRALPPAEPAPLKVEPVGAWSPPSPTPDDPFADLVLPPRSAVAPAPKPAPRPVAAPPPPPPVVAKPAPSPAPKPAPRPAPKPVVAMPTLPPAPQPRVEPTLPDEPRRQSIAVPILIGVLAFIAGLVVAVIVVIRLAGPSGILNPRTEPSAPATARTVDVPPPAPAASTEPAPPAVEPRPESSKVAPPVERAPAPAAPVVARPRRHAPAATASAEDNAALHAPSAVVIPVQKIHSETMAPVSPSTPTPAPAAPAPSTELGILCGAVLDSEGHPVARAQVMMADVGVVVLTDRAGRFCLTAPAGERTLSVVALGFTTARRLVALGKRTPEINIKLNSAAPFPTPH